jgi:hypothetical protein
MRVRIEIADDWLLDQVNAPAHTALSVREFLAEKKCIRMLPRAPSSPDLSPCDFYLFPKLKSRVKRLEGCNLRHQDLSAADFQSCHEARKIRWPKCLSDGCHVEEDCSFTLTIEQMILYQINIITLLTHVVQTRKRS